MVNEEFWKDHFPKDPQATREWRAYVHVFPLACRVLCVATSRIEGAWCAYCDAVPGMLHDQEYPAVLAHGDKMGESIARAMFPEFEGVPYDG